MVSLAKTGADGKVSAPTMETIVCDILQQKAVRPYVEKALQKAGIEKAAAAAPAATPAPTPAPNRIIDAHTAVKLRYTAGTKQRGEQAYRNELQDSHVPVKAIIKHQNELFCKECPKVYFPCEGNAGLAVHGPKTVEMMLQKDFYWDLLDQSGKRAGKYLCRESDDGTNAQEYTTESIMIKGHNCLNAKRDAGLHGLACQSTSMYVPQVIAPMTESKSSIHELYSHATSLWDTPGLKIKAAGRPELEYVGFNVADDSATSKARKLTGTSSDWFCPFCTLCRQSWRDGKRDYKPGYENSIVDEKTLHLVPEVDKDTGDIVGADTVQKSVRYPIKKRVWLDPNCDHRYWEHDCACMSILMKVIMDHYDYTAQQYLTQATQDLALSKEVLEEYLHMPVGRGAGKINRKQYDKNVREARKAVKHNEESVQCYTKRLEYADFSPWHSKNPDHNKILALSKRLTFGQTGVPVHRHGSVMEIDDPFHIGMNTFKTQNWAVLISAFRTIGQLQQLQFWLFETGLKHIDLGNHSEDFDIWISSNQNRDRIKKPQEPRADLTGKETKEIFCNYSDAIERLSSVAPDKVAVIKTVEVLTQVHTLYQPLFTHLKATKNFLPLVDGKMQNPSAHCRAAAQAYDDYFTSNVGAANGFDVVGLDLMMEPWHCMVTHVPDWIDELWEKYDLMIGELSCEIVEHYNKLICKFIEHRTNNHESMTSLDDNKFFQTFRHFLVQIMCFPETLFKPERKRKCGVCRESGHNKTNTKKCKQNVKYKPLYGIVYGDEVEE